MLEDLKYIYNDVNHLKVYLYNSKFKIYSNGNFKAIKYSFDIVKGRINETFLHNGKSSKEELEHYHKQYLKVVRNEIIDLALNNLNLWEYFVTLTFNDLELGGTYSHIKVLEKLQNWLKVQRRNNPNMYYLFVPEFHKSGRIHFHGLVGNVPNWKLEKSRNSNNNRLIKVNGKQIYNLLNYKLGFSTISFIEDKFKVSLYISKYVTKDLIDLKHKKRYWYSRNLSKPKVFYSYFNGELLDLSDNFKMTNYLEIEKDNSQITIANFQL